MAASLVLSRSQRHRDAALPHVVHMTARWVSGVNGARAALPAARASLPALAKSSMNEANMGSAAPCCSPRPSLVSTLTASQRAMQQIVNGVYGPTGVTAHVNVGEAKRQGIVILQRHQKQVAKLANQRIVRRLQHAIHNLAKRSYARTELGAYGHSGRRALQHAGVALLSEPERLTRWPLSAASQLPALTERRNSAMQTYLVRPPLTAASANGTIGAIALCHATASESDHGELADLVEEMAHTASEP